MKNNNKKIKIISISALAIIAGFVIWRMSRPTIVTPEHPQNPVSENPNTQTPNAPTTPNEQTPTEPTTPNQPTTPTKPTEEPIVSEETTYKLITLTTTQPGAEIIAAVGRSNVAATLALNRIDDKHLFQGMTVVIPNSFDHAEDFAFMPTSIETANTIPKLVIISQRTQAFGFYENGALVRSGPVSSGKQSTPTPSRLYFANWKGKEVVSTFSDEWILKWNFNVANFEGIGLHHYAMPGYPASHSCVRFYIEDAEFLYNWGDQWILDADGQTKLASGTPVIIYGSYNFSKAAPWKRLPTDPKAVTITEKELNELITKNMETIQKEQTKREQVVAARGM
jgi:lipoprotein-anchoring transpeptidase ErfK/SrfK